MRVIQVIGWAFLGVAAVMLIVIGVLYARDSSYVRTSSRTIGVVTELVAGSSDGSGVSTRVRFTTAGRHPVEFVENLSTNPPRYAVGDHVPVLYDPNRPSSAMIDDFWSHYLGVVVLSVFVAIFGILGSIFSLIGTLAGRRRAQILRDGVPVMADFVEVVTDSHFKINGRRPFRVIAEARDPTGRLQRFRSELIQIDPTDRLRGQKVKVIVDGSSGGYVVDLSNIVGDRYFWRAR